uniref:Uncharacterized protein n=1 Tax=viral metagenome TaxID=1070528 RepID=A0A6C0BXW4_9ZZZZ
MQVLNSIYSTVCSEKKKERFETILEPLQAITQIALLSFCPKGTKLSISNNLLFVQQPTWKQGLFRSYNHDARDDLYFLFNVIRRFNTFYTKSELGETDTGRQLFSRLIELSKGGIDKLIQTYSDSDKNALLHTLRMYRTMLEKPDVFETETDTSDEKNSIDDIFINITKIYKPHHIDLINNTILLTSESPEHYDTYLTGLNIMLDPIQSQINKWISDNIVF